MSTQTTSKLSGMTAREFSTFLQGKPKSVVDLALRIRCEQDRTLFCKFFFPHRFTKPWNKMHLDFLSRKKVPFTHRKEVQRIADAAPRNGAKSTLESYADLLHDAVYGYEAFVPIISTTFDLSQGLVKDLHTAFTEPEALPDFHRVFGPFEVIGTQTDFVVHCPHGILSGTRFKSFSFGGTIRGHKHCGLRPSKVIIDDGEHPERVRSPEQREKTMEYLLKDVLQAGDEYTIYRIIGTVLHPDSMLANILKASGWVSKTWKAVIAWPKNTTLWDECRAIWSKLENAERVKDAKAFYEKNKDLMDEGSQILWPGGESLWALYLQLWANGESSFYSEKQNEPRDPTRSIFDIKNFKRCKFDGVRIITAEGRTVLLTDCEIVHWLDPSLGKDHSDFPALATLAKEKKTGYRFVLKCSLERDVPSEQRNKVWQRWADFAQRGKVGVDRIGVGALFSESFEQEKKLRRQTGLPWKMEVEGYHSSENKNVRIARLEPDTRNGFLQFADDLPLALFEQFRDFPGGTFDDGPDAIERADWMFTNDKMPTLGSVSLGV